MRFTFNILCVILYAHTHTHTCSSNINTVLVHVLFHRFECFENETLIIVRLFATSIKLFNQVEKTKPINQM